MSGPIWWLLVLGLIAAGFGGYLQKGTKGAAGDAVGIIVIVLGLALVVASYLAPRFVAKPAAAGEVTAAPVDSTAPTAAGVGASGPVSPVGDEPTSLAVSPADGGSGFGSQIIVRVAVRSAPPAAHSYWLIREFRGGVHLVYKASPLVPGGSPRPLELTLESGVGSSRTLYVVDAAGPAARTLAVNASHQEPGWDGNRTSLPAGTVVVSDRVPVVKTRP
jgi:hypothetical protein